MKRKRGSQVRIVRFTTKTHWGIEETMFLAETGK
jgi:hypothetical protein